VFPGTVVPSDGDWIDVPFPEKGAPELHRPQRTPRPAPAPAAAP
jgi:ribonuclease Z